MKNTDADSPYWSRILALAVAASAPLAGAAAARQPRRHTRSSFGDRRIVVRQPDADTFRVLHSHSGGKNICITSHTTPAHRSVADVSLRNHYAYAKRHGYTYIAFEGRLSGARFVDPTQGPLSSDRGGGVAWQKYAALEMLAGKLAHGDGLACAWLMYISPAAVVTNPTIPLESILSAHAGATAGASTISVVLPRENSNLRGNFVHSGVFFLRNEAGGRAFLSSIGHLFEAYKDSKDTEQDAVNRYVFGRDTRQLGASARPELEAHSRQDVAIAPNKAFGSFYWPAPHEGCSAEALWQPCDLVAYIAGYPAKFQQRFMRELSHSAADCEAAATDASAIARS